jgi:L-lactate dehydrogenase complex protein LldE
MSESPQPLVGLFVTCLADLMRPSVAFSTIKLLEQAGCEVDVPLQQTCCGQPAYNTGDYNTTRPMAQQLIERFAEYPYVVAPSGSCAGMIKHHYPRLFTEMPDWHNRALDLAARTWEITSFLVDVLDFQPEQLAAASTHRTFTYHDSCAGLRELDIKSQPRQLLKSVNGIEITEMQATEVCCGFGGTFCAKMPEISGKMVGDKLQHALDSGADVLLGGDLGCLLNISGYASRQGKSIEIRHVTEVLAGELGEPGIGEGKS